MRGRVAAPLVTLLCAEAASAAFTRNILITGYWPPTNEMVRRFSTSPEQNPGGWAGDNWEGRGYDIYSFFPEFPDGLGRGVGDLEVDYQDTSEDWWRITAEIDPVAIITFSRGNLDRSWEVERWQRNLETWVGDFDAPFQPTPSPPDDSVPAGTRRESTLPMGSIVDAVNDQTRLNAFVSEDNGGAFLSEFIAYHGVWYQSIHSDPSDLAWSVAAGHVHVGSQVTVNQGIRATEITLRELIDYVDTVIPEPATLAGLLAPALLFRVRAPRGRGRGSARSGGVETRRSTLASCGNVVWASQPVQCTVGFQPAASSATEKL
jgi:hypothetical protein